MIGHINGEVAEKFTGAMIVDVNGVGYEIAVTALDFEAVNVGEKRKFYTYHAVRENSEDLYGFTSLAAKKMFELLITVQGVGPKAAMAILSLASAEDVRNAIANADVAFVSKASGVGKKSAERVIVDLRDKVGVPSHVGATDIIGPSAATQAEPDEALDALIALGFPLKEATDALAKVDKNLSVEERIKMALKK
ncbi:MAG: Holliday junction branch migration protein RuvA [Candidatus Saccharibacteria bacterium]|nr:Holliday junction branch migration protein RuvA [Candidatus Saccharibacteria bacterium]